MVFMRRSRLCRFRSRNHLEVVFMSFSAHVTFAFHHIFFAVINRIYHIDGIINTPFTIANLYDKHIIDRNFITSHNMLTLYEDTINPILFARNIFRCTQFESHSSKFSHCLSQRTVVNDIRNGDTWRMIRIDGNIDYMSRLYHFSENRSLLQNDIRRQRADISRIRYNNFQSRIVEDMCSIIDILISNIRHTDGLTMMGIDINAVLDTGTEQHQHQNHGTDIPPKELTLKLIYKL